MSYLSVDIPYGEPSINLMKDILLRAPLMALKSASKQELLASKKERRLKLKSKRLKKDASKDSLQRPVPDCDFSIVSSSKASVIPRKVQIKQFSMNIGIESQKSEKDNPMSLR